MPFPKDYRKGRETHEVGIKAFNDVLKEWRDAPKKKKPELALAIMSHAGSMGRKLKDLIEDEKTIQAIKEDVQKL